MYSDTAGLPITTASVAPAPAVTIASASRCAQHAPRAAARGRGVPPSVAVVRGVQKGSVKGCGRRE
eukprot:2900648-Prymnesium_polylepis.1